MSYNPPTLEQLGWGPPLLETLEFLKANTDGLSEANDAMNDRISNIEAAPEGLNGFLPIVFDFDLPQTGDTSQILFLPKSTVELTELVLAADSAPIGAPVVVDLEIDSGSGFVSILDSNEVLEIGTNWYVAAPPALQTAPPGSRIRARIVSAPVTELSELERNTNVGSTNSTTNAVTNVTMSKPSGANTGDLLVAVIGRQGPTVTLSADWTVRAEVQSDPTTVQNRLTVATAVNSPTLSMACGLSSGSPALSMVFAFSGFDIDLPVSTPITHGMNNEGHTMTFGNYTVGNDEEIPTEPDEHILWCALSRYGAADEGRVHNWTGADEILESQSARGVGNTDVGLSVAELTVPILADEDSVPNPSVGDATGSAFTSWCSVIIGIRKGLSAGAATRMTVQTMARWTDE